MTIAASPPVPQASHVFQRISIYKSGTKVIEEEEDVIATPGGAVARTGKCVFSIPMTTTVKLDPKGEEIPLQIRVPLRASTLFEAWNKYDAELRANYEIGVQNELLRRKLITLDPPVDEVKA